MNTPNSSRSCDRFIPLRGSSLDSLKVSHTYLSPSHVSCREYCKLNTAGNNGMNFMQQHYRNSVYQNALKDCMFDNPRRTLYFSPKQKSIRTEEWKIIDDWPVKARRNPVINKPSLVLDLPEIEINFNGSHQKVDWGANNFIAVLLRREVYAINPDNNCRLCIKTLDQNLGNCIKWNKEGNRLAVSLKKRTIILWDFEMGRPVNSLRVKQELTSISYIIYSSRLLILTFMSGAIQIYSQNTETFVASVQNAHDGTIVLGKVSCNERYLATSGVDGYVRIWELPTCRSICYIDCHQDIILALDWHPWKEPLLVLGGCSENSFCHLFNVNSPKTSVREEHPNSPKVDCVSFNPISAELVVSFWLDNPLPNQSRQHIVVQRNVETVVDDINFHTTRTPYLLWSPKGTQLATAGTDESLVIWDFLEQQNEKKIIKKLFPNESFLQKCTIR